MAVFLVPGDSWICRCPEGRRPTAIERIAMKEFRLCFVPPFVPVDAIGVLRASLSPSQGIEPRQVIPGHRCRALGPSREAPGLHLALEEILGRTVRPRCTPRWSGEVRCDNRGGRRGIPGELATPEAGRACPGEHRRNGGSRVSVSISRSVARGVAAGAAVAVLCSAPAARADDEIAITVHHGYGTQREFVVEGRVAERNGERESLPDDPWYVNLWRSLQSFQVEEEKKIPLLLTLAGRTWELRSDDEGYFTFRGETPAQATPGWQPLRVEAVGGAIRTEYPLLIVPDGEVLGIISDVDDTVVVSEVGDRSRLLAHTFLKNYLQRRAIPGVADFYRSLAARNTPPDVTPVIYLTATPRHLLSSLNDFLEHNGFPPGPILAKKVTDGAGGDPLLDQERYKLARIEAILADLPGVRFVLSGDDGERDPEVFNAIRERHPTRIEAVYIRKVSPEPSRRTFEGQQTLP